MSPGLISLEMHLEVQVCSEMGIICLQGVYWEMIPVFFGHCRSRDKKAQALSASSGRRCSSPPGVPGSLCNAQPQDKGWGLAHSLQCPGHGCQLFHHPASWIYGKHPTTPLVPTQFSWRVSWEGNGDGKQSGFVCWFNASQIAGD